MSKTMKSAAPRNRHVRGSIGTVDGKPAAKLTVVARSGDPDGASRILGSGATNAQGAYVVEYPDSAKGSADRVDLFLVVFADAAQLIELATSRVVRNAPAETLLDVILPPPQPEYTDYLARLQPRLAGRTL